MKSDQGLFWKSRLGTVAFFIYRTSAFFPISCGGNWIRAQYTSCPRCRVFLTNFLSCPNKTQTSSPLFHFLISYRDSFRWPLRLPCCSPNWQTFGIFIFSASLYHIIALLGSNFRRRWQIITPTHKKNIGNWPADEDKACEEPVEVINKS